MLKARWTQFGQPMSPRVIFVRGIGDGRVTQEDIDTYGAMSEDPEVVCEHIGDDPEANHRIAGLAPEAPGVHDPDEAERVRAPSRPQPVRPQRGGKRSWLDVLLRR